MSIVTPSVGRLQKYFGYVCVVNYIAQKFHCTYMLFDIKTISNFVNVLHFYHHTHVKNFVYLPTIFQGLTRIRYFSFLLRDIRAFSEKKKKNDMFRLPTELEYVLCWPCNMDVYLTCHFLTHAFLPKAYYVYGQFYQILPMSYNVIRNSAFELDLHLFCYWKTVVSIFKHYTMYLNYTSRMWHEGLCSQNGPLNRIIFIDQ